MALTEVPVRSGQIVFRLGTAADRPAIFRMRHDVYARELGQHSENPGCALSDDLDEFNQYVVAECEGRIAGFVSVTPPERNRYSIDKYFERDELPFAVDESMYEIRILTVAPERRGTPLAGLLMYAAYRWIEERGGRTIVAIGRREVLSVYLKAGMRREGRSIRSGRVSYELLSGTVSELRRTMGRFEATLRKLETRIEWALPMPLIRGDTCYHGGSFFERIGVGFDALENRREVINADVNDAWFPPAPEVLDGLRTHLDWFARTSPPTHSEGMVAAIAAARGVPEAALVAGAGSSALMFAALPRLLNRDSRVLLLHPTYGEYAHVLKNVIGCRVDEFFLHRRDGYDVDLDRLAEVLRRRYDMVILVNPNSPTGRFVEGSGMRDLLRECPASTLVWVDETYLEFASPDESVETPAAGSENVIVCKSMSKVYALSGMRAAYLCGSPEVLAPIRSAIPPWAVSLPAQFAAVTALDCKEYYRGRWCETAALRASLKRGLERLGLEVLPGTANFLLVNLPDHLPAARVLLERCRERGLYLRDLTSLDADLGRRAFRIAVKSAEEQGRMLGGLEEVISGISVRVDSH